MSVRFPSAREHWPAVFLAFVVGMVSIGPQLYTVWTAQSGSGIAMMGADAEDHYVARIQEVYDGYPTAGNVFTSLKNTPPLEPNLGEYLVAKLGMFFHLSASQITIVGKFLFPFMVALILYSVVFTLSQRHLMAGLSVLYVMFGEALISKPLLVLKILQGTYAPTGFLNYARPINPEISAIFLFGCMAVVARLFFDGETRQETPSTKYLLVFAGLLCGLSLYVSFYSYLFLIVFGGLQFLIALWSREFQKARELLVVGIVAGLCAVPFILNILAAQASPVYAETAMRFGVISTHAPVLGLWIPIMLLVSLFLRGSLVRVSNFFIVGFLAVTVILNQQLITGHALQAGHFHWYVTKPLVGMLLGIVTVMVAERVLRKARWRYVLYGLAAVAVTANALIIQRASYVAVSTSFHDAQVYAPVLDYLNDGEQKTVWSNRDLSTYIPIYTSDDAINNHYALYYLVSNEFLSQRILLEYKLEGVEPPEILSTLRRDRGDVSGRVFGVYWREEKGRYDAIPDEVLESYARRYEQLYNEQTASLLADLGVTQVVWDTARDPEWRLQNYSGLIRQATVGRFEIYRLQNEPVGR